MVLDAVSVLVQLATAIHGAAEAAKANKQRCSRLAQRVQVLASAVKRLEQAHPARVQQLIASGALDRCRAVVDECHRLVADFAEKRSFLMRMVKHRTMRTSLCAWSQALQDEVGALSLERHSGRVQRSGGPDGRRPATCATQRATSRAARGAARASADGGRPTIRHGVRHV